MENAVICIVEDDRMLADQMKHFLEQWSVKAYVPLSFKNIDQWIEEMKPDLILMDVVLPYFDGFYWMHRIHQKQDIPILFISSRASDTDAILAMSQGADDYLEKPFRLDLLKAKIEAVLRRYKTGGFVYEIKLENGFSYWPGKGLLTYKDTAEIELTKTEKKIMDLLSSHLNCLVSRTDLIMYLWQTDEYISDGTLTTSISRLRSKVKALSKQDIIQTAKGKGYLLK